MISKILLGLLAILTFPIRTLFPAKLKLERVVIHIPDQNKALPNDKLRIVQLSDVHWDPQPRRITNELFEQVIETVNELLPDLIVITGDFVECFPSSIDVLAHQFLTKLKSKHGIYAVLGNHDYKFDYRQNATLIKVKKIRRRENGVHPPMDLTGAQKIKDVLKLVGVKVLTNEKAFPLGDGYQDFEIIGIGDYYSPEYHPELALQNHHNDTKNKISVVLSHNPDTANKLAEYDYTIQLSGHTHGGQVGLPNGKPVLAVIAEAVDSTLPHSLKRKLPRPIRRLLFGVVSNWKWYSGLHAVQRKGSDGQNLLYVSRGLATHPPMRLFCDPEVTVIDLVKSCAVDQHEDTAVKEIKVGEWCARLLS